MKIKQAIGVMLSLFLAFSTFTAAQAKDIGASGNPLPRFVSVASEKVFMRTGPGRQYPIDWVFERKGLPMEIIEEYGPWRKVKDYEGALGWIHVSLLSGKRTAMILKGPHALYSEPNHLSPARIIAETHVIGKVDECEKVWCALEIDGTVGWIKKAHVWGIYKSDIID